MGEKRSFAIRQRASILCGIEGETVWLRYLSLENELTERVVTITDLYEAFGTLFIDAFCHLRGDDRTFRLDRVHLIRELTDDGNVYDSCVAWLASYGVSAEIYERGNEYTYRICRDSMG